MIYLTLIYGKIHKNPAIYHIFSLLYSSPDPERSKGRSAVYNDIKNGMGNGSRINALRSVPENPKNNPYKKGQKHQPGEIHRNVSRKRSNNKVFVEGVSGTCNDN